MTRGLHFVIDHYLALPLGAIVALLWANTMPPTYFAAAHRVAFAVNDVGMTLFFGLMMREVIEATAPDGTLDTRRRLALPFVMAAGGVIGAVSVYAACLQAGDEGSVLGAGWPVVCATDVAFSYCIARSVCHARALPFLLLAGIVSNAIALVVLEFLYPIHEVHSAGAGLVMVGLVAAVIMRRCDVRPFWPYIAGPGTLAWCGLFLSGLHPALALVPIVPFLPRTLRTRHSMADAPPGARDTLNRFHRALKYPTHVILFLFGVANAGVILRGAGTGTWAVAMAALLGKPVGSLIALVIAVPCGLHLPRSVGWREMVVLAIACSTGFTFALFFATVAYPIGPVLSEVKLGALATGGAAGLTVAAAWALRAGRFARQRRRRRSVAGTAEYAGA